MSLRYSPPAMKRVSVVAMLVSTFAASSRTGGDGRPRNEPATRTGSLFGDWPSGTSPEEVGRRLIANYLERALPAGEMHYAEASTWYGALTTAQLIGDAALRERLIKRFDPILAAGSTPTGRSPIIPSRAHVDDRVFGIVPLEIYIESKDPRYLTIGQDL